MPPFSDALAAALPDLTCPHCGAGLTRTDRGVDCAAGHGFDLARQGYLSLLSGARRAGDGDTAAMVAARADFLGAGHYSPITDALLAELPAPGAGCVADLGAGTGHYLATVLDALPDRTGLALDVSRYALRRAARAHPRMAAIGADAWAGLPVRDASVALALNVFAPRNPVELRRVLAPGATLLVVTPTPAHLHQLVAHLGLIGVDADKDQRLAASLGPVLEAAGARRVEFDMSLDHAALAAVVGMGPSARHHTAETLAAGIAALPEPATVTASVTVSTYRRAAAG